MDRRSFVIGTPPRQPRWRRDRPSRKTPFPRMRSRSSIAFPPGGANDIVTRPLAAALEPILKQPVVIETKAGAGGQVGAQVAANAKPDGYTLLSHNTGISGFAEVDKLFGRAPKFTRADFIPLARLIADPVVLLVNDKQPYKTLKDFIDDAKKRPDAIVYSSGGLYGATHLPMALFAKAAGGPKMRHLPTNGGGPAITALLGNNAQVERAIGVGLAHSHIKAGKLRPLALFGAKRSKVLPDVPTLKELGYDVEYYLWVGLFAPKGTPAPPIAVLSAGIDKAAHSDQFKTALTNLGLESRVSQSAGLRQVLGGRRQARRSKRSTRSAGCRDKKRKRYGAVKVQ